MTDANGGHNERNSSSRRRLADLASRLDADDLGLEIDEAWTVGALLGHVAFWDRLVESRWRYAQRTGTVTPIGLDDELTDLINAAAIPGWRVLDPRRAAALVVTAAEDVDALIASLPAASVEGVLGEGRPRLLDRSLHRSEHIATIEARLAR
ncbi:MAG TPA: DinB family protein [Candidatus Limnocylindrales bacterium]|nr:DinB family protein [Candidatus Limnocylindrales bacterium]